MKQIEFQKQNGQNNDINSKNNKTNDKNNETNYQHNSDQQQIDDQQQDYESKHAQNNEIKINKHQALFTQINVMMGAGPLIIPSVFYEAGVVLSSVFLFLIGFLSYICAEFIVESMSICNYIQETKRRYEESQSKTEENFYQSRIDDSQIVKNTNMFELNKKYEYGQMAEILINKNSQFLISFIIIIYLIGVTIMKCMATAQILSHQFNEYDLIGNYYFWLIIFFLVSALFSFKSVQDTQKLQSFIFCIRILTVIGMLIGCYYQIGITQIHPLSTAAFPLISFSGFNHFFSNSVFAFNMHHSIPSMVKPISPSKDIKSVFKNTFIIAFSVFFSVSFSGILAFGDSLVEGSDIKLFNFNFKEHIQIVYYLAGFYVFLNITAFPVMIITSRNNLIALFPSVFNSEEDIINQNKLDIPKIMATLIILTPILLASILLTNIQVVLNVIGGIFGATILIIIPSLLLLYGRKKISVLSSSLNEKDFIHKTAISSNFLPQLVLTVGCICCVYNTFLTINKIIQ